MTDKQALIDEIRKRHDKDQYRLGGEYYPDAEEVHADRATLLSLLSNEPPSPRASPDETGPVALDLDTGAFVEKVGGDDEFCGRIVAAFPKFDRELSLPTGPQRFVVQDDRGALHIYSGKNLRRLSGIPTEPPVSREMPSRDDLNEVTRAWVGTLPLNVLDHLKQKHITKLHEMLLSRLRGVDAEQKDKV